MPILVGIDGTSGDAFGDDTPQRHAEYDALFANSFVNRICRLGGANTRYFRGPGWLPADNGLMHAIWSGRDFIAASRRAGNNEPILLTGYSRGAAGVIVIAKMLSEPNYNIAIDAMLLFDCVNRNLVTNTDIIPANVGAVCHVVRSEASNSRKSFGHSGMRAYPGSKTVYRPPQPFDCTHGAMGGTPWPLTPGVSPNAFISEGFGAYGVPEEPTRVTYAQDGRGAEAVQEYVKPFMNEHGFPIPSDVPYSRACTSPDPKWLNWAPPPVAPRTSNAWAPRVPVRPSRPR